MMKKKLFLVLFGLVVCGGFLNAQTQSIDEAVLRASIRMGADLPAGATVAVIHFRADPQTLATYMVNQLHGTLLRNRSVTPIRPNEEQLQNIRDTLRFNAEGGIEEEAARSIGRLLGVRYLIIGSVERSASAYEILVVAVDVESAESKSRYSASVNPNDAALASVLGITPAFGGTSTSDSAPALVDLDTWRNKRIYLGGMAGVGLVSMPDNYLSPVLGFVSEFSLLPFLSLEVDLDIGLGISIIDRSSIFIFSPTLMAKFGYRFPRIELFFDIGYTILLGDIFFAAPEVGVTFGVKVGPGILFGKSSQTAPILTSDASSFLGKYSLGYKVGVVDKKKKPAPQTDTTQSDTSDD